MRNECEITQGWSKQRIIELGHFQSRVGVGVGEAGDSAVENGTAVIWEHGE